MYTVKILLLLLINDSTVFSFIFGKNLWKTSYQHLNIAEKQKASCDKPLILTPYIQDGKIDEAQKLSKVNLKDINDIESYSGFLTVNATCNSNMFFWFFPSERKEANDPLVLWLQGGPGGSSLYGLAVEIGPFYIENGTTLKRREYHWSDKRNLLFIDNPVGTGYSFTKNTSECYSQNEDDVRKNLYSALLQFFKLFPNLQRNDLFLFGESYAGKYIPAIAYSIYENNKNASIKLNLKGLGIGDGFTDPVSTLAYSDLLYNIGIIHNYDRNRLKVMEDKCVQVIRDKDWEIAEIQVSLYFIEMAKLIKDVNIYNYLQAKTPPLSLDYFNREDVKCMVHASNTTYSSFNYIVYEFMTNDYLKSVKPWVEELVEHYNIMFYNGNLDIIVGSVLTQNFLQTLKWSGAEKFKVAEESGYYIGYDLVAWESSYGHLSEVRVRNAGHMAPLDQPKSMYHIMEKFINQTLLNA